QNERSWEALAQEGPAVIALRDALTPSVLHAPGLLLRGRVDPAVASSPVTGTTPSSSPTAGSGSSSATSPAMVR
ncbi:hypothetical protein, partial [Parafrankia sp. CH37]|uniref:hypothetical protein n=1 Tax=Parafrankia sp. CH37 TaxID=683308 RepID=UPI001D015129